ncbi:fumarylacetoacetate hydrolase family protein [Lentithecium fluviatile CBS 122367]|uniref:Fumarylacetoacetate hydrolase family protein n=1 Tax=Lentithecium fluviatile CBS 122367 TaxID=1168545 RepID=A0A6G1JL53_9PLEO|nr:fumarylacetoacetate hydrolase family protein [Lentithecium fluviatile CBS 122367]
MPSFNRLVRFENESGQVMYGDVPDNVGTPDSFVGTRVDVFEGDTPWGASFQRTARQDVIAKVLAPLPHVPIFIGVGMNYKTHVGENKTDLPQYPVLFNKPSGALAGPEDDIPIHKEAQLLDYEGELCVIIGKDAKNLSNSEDPLDYVLGYTVGNDVSSRWWQMPERSGQQAGYAKSFDKFAPIGPVIVPTSKLPNLSKQTITTRVNREERQKSEIDLIFDVSEMVTFLSRGRTLESGTVIMTGTPSGVAFFMKPPGFVKDGDVVEVEITGIGKIRNKHVFEK